MPLPPYAQLLDLSIEESPEGRLFVMPPHDAVVGRPGFLHGGAIAGLCEYAAFASLRRALDEPGVLLKPITVTIDYLRGGKLRPTRARAEIVRLGRRIAHLEVRAWQDEEAEPIALARLNFLLRRPAQ